MERPAPAPDPIEEPLLRPVLAAGRAFWITVAVLLGVMAFGGYHWGRQTQIGLGYTGETRPVYWGLYLVNYVFFIGISHAGTLISAILRLTNAGWRRPITRAAEAITVFALAMGASNVLWHLGRPERIWVPLIYPQFLSPLIWDVVCISTYLVGSIIYLYLPLIPDLALLRERSPQRRWLYRALALGWQGTDRQHRYLSKAIGVMAVIIIPIAVSVHTVVSWVFAMTLVPMWHSTIFGPYFVVGAIFSGIAAILVAMAILRKVFHLEAFFRPVHFNNLGLLLLTLCCLWTYFTFAEHLTTWYGNVPEEMAVFKARLSGPFAPQFWMMLFSCFVIPFIILAFKKTRTIAGTVVASLSVLLGMWLERYVIVIGSASFPRLAFNWDLGTYSPTLVEKAMTAAQFACFILMFAVFTKLFPIVSIWEVKEGESAQSLPS